MVTFIDIEKKIFLGLKEACKDAFRFTGVINEQIEPEYIVTVNIAKQLNEINSDNSGFGTPLIIKVEEDTTTFASECVPLELWEDIFNSKLRDAHNADRNGKIDIAVYETIVPTNFENRVPKCPIEVKKFNPPKSEIIKDLLRNLDYFKISDKTGENRLDKAYLTCLHHDKDCLFVSNKDKGIEKAKEYYKKQTSIFAKGLKELNLKLRIEAETVEEYLFNDNDKFEGQDPDYISDRAYESFHHIGILMVIERDVKKK